MKVLQINSVFKYGSTGRIVKDLMDNLEEKNHTCMVAYGRGEKESCVRIFNISLNIEVNLHGIISRITDKHGFYSKMATKRLIKKIREYNPDIIHLHNLHGYYINLEILFNYLKEENKSVVWTLHDCWAFTGHCSHFDFIKCDKWMKKCFKCPQQKNYPKSLVFDNSEWNFQMKKKIFSGLSNMIIVTPSRWLNELVKKSFLSEYPTQVIHNGIDLDIFKPKEGIFRAKYKLENKFIILGVANVWNDRKGLEIFLELSKKIDENSIIVMVGLSKKQKRSLPPNIIGICRTNNINELVEIYSDADVFINPTLEDTFPTTNIESIACGTPVITFNTGGCSEIIDDSCGKVIEKNFNILLKSIKNISKKDLYKKRCLDKAKKFNKFDKFDEYIKIYEMIGGALDERS